jgi:DNA helicase II / ATP-dependent DNA helicase PcrA
MTDKEKIQNRLPYISTEKLKDLSDKQVEFIVSPINQSIYLKACPGSGKTEVVGLKSAYEIADWKEKYSGLAILSFTRNAAKEISERISKYSGINSTRHPHFVGTIDSWLHKYILHPFGHKILKYKGINGDKSFRLVDNKEKYLFLSPYITNIFENSDFKQNVFVNEFYFECNDQLILQSQSRVFKCENITDEQKKQLLNKKKDFLKAGLATYADAEFICFFILSKNKSILSNIKKRFPCIFIDECQDLSYNQLQILQLLYNEGIKLFFIGDLNQAIYEFRKVYTENIEDFIRSNDFIQKELPRNFRSNQQIVDVCQNIEKIIKEDKIGSKIEGKNLIYPRNVYLWEYENIKELPKKFINFIETEYNKDHFIDINNYAILGRGYSLLSEIRTNLNYELDKVELFANSLICWNISNRTGNDMKNALQQIGKSISNLAYGGKGNYQQQYCPDGISQLEWRKFLYELILKANKQIYPFGDRTWSDWANNRLKIFLKNEWTNLLIKGEEWEEVKRRIRVRPSKKKKRSKEEKQKDKKIVDTLSVAPSDFSDEIRIATIHSVKGETLDAVMLVSSETKNSEGGHYEHWISNLPEHNEYIRFAYVASSRPKNLLIWAIPKIKKDRKKILEELNKILNIESVKK